MPAIYRHRDTHRRRTHGALQLALSVSVPVAVAAWVIGCDEGETQPPVQPPVAVGSMPELTVVVDSTESVDLAGHFSDPDGDELSYWAWSSNAEVATVAISGDSVAVTGVASGSAEITVTGTDDGGFSAAQDFTASVRFTERQVLEILYDELGGYGWPDNTNWKTDNPLDEWHGVSTNADGQVDTLSLRGNYLAGEIPPELGSLSNLELLLLGDNSLTGEIPSELGDLSNLEWLDLGSNSLTGEIPPGLGSLPDLEGLSLSYNSLTGEIPPELGDLSNLELLDLVGNSLTGEIPSELGSLWDLRGLVLHQNSLTGAIPPELGDLSSLERLYLGGNSLTGEIPLDFLDLSSLEWLYWSANEGLCAPDTTEFDSWLDGLLSWRGPRCD